MDRHGMSYTFENPPKESKEIVVIFPDLKEKHKGFWSVQDQMVEYVGYCYMDIDHLLHHGFRWTVSDE